MIEKIEFRTTSRQQLIDLGDKLIKIVRDSDVMQGICFVYTPHSTAGLIVAPPFDNTKMDIQFEIDKLIPTRVDFFHNEDPPSDAAGHIKSALLGVSQFFLIDDGKLILGHAHGILFYEFDGPRDREVYVRIMEG